MTTQNPGAVACGGRTRALAQPGVVAGTRVMSARLAVADETAARESRLRPGGLDTRPKEALERIEVVTASPDEAQILEVHAGAALLTITRTAVDSADEPFEFSHDLFRGDRTRIIVRSPGHDSAADAYRGQGRVIELRSQTATLEDRTHAGA